MNPDLYSELVKQINSLQKQVDGLVKPEVGRWIDWTPVVTQSVVVAKTIVEAKYKIRESDVRIYCQLNVTAAGTAGNAISISGWPAGINPSPSPQVFPVGTGVIYDVGVHAYGGVCWLQSATAVALTVSDANYTEVGISPNFALANGDFIYFNMYWKIA